MRYVISVDSRGYKRRFLVRDEDGDEDAQKGIPAGPPNLDELDIEAIKKEINNSLVDQGLFTWSDINHSTVGLGVIQSVMKRHVAGLFKEEQARVKQTNG